MDATGAVSPAATSAVSEGSSTTIEVGYSSSISGDIAAFEGSLQAAEQANQTAMKSLVEPLDFINQEANDIINYAQNAVQSGNELTPSEIVMLTARSQEFMFHSTLTANIANRTADGLSQLFRQQS